MSTDELHLTASEQDAVAGLDATGQAALVQAGDVGAADLVRAAIARIEAVNPRLNAVVTTAFDQAVDAAAAVQRGAPLAGVPYLLKDLAVEAAGMRFCEGSAFLRDHVSTFDQYTTVGLRRAGLVILGKTNTPEFGMSPTTEPRLFGATANPWDPRRTAGGSSGGSAAAVAAGMVPMAYGNDAGGSIRIPAACCGLFGLKPTRGRTSLGPAYGDVFTGWAVEHALTRSVRDSAALLDAMAGTEKGDPYSTPSRPGEFSSALRRPPRRLRIAVTRRAAEDRVVHPDCVSAADRAADLLADLGHELVERELPELTAAEGRAIGRIYGASVDWVVRYWIERLGRTPGPDELEPLTRERGRHVSGGDLLLAVTTLQLYARRLARESAGLDGWLSPTVAEPPPMLGEMVADEADPTVAEARAAAFVAIPLVIANITGLPAMSVPLHWTADGLPIGVHVLGRYADEATLLQLAAQLEQAAPWGGRRPMVHAGAG